MKEAKEREKDRRNRSRHKSRREQFDSEDDEDRISRRRKGKRDESVSSASGDDSGWAGRSCECGSAKRFLDASSFIRCGLCTASEKEKSTYIRATQADHQMKMHQAESNHHLRDIQDDEPEVEEEPAQRQVNYTFGDAGPQWHMTKLKAVYKTVEETGRSVEDVVLERYGDLLDFDDAREEIEVDRRKMYDKDYVGKEKTSGELYQQRKLVRGIKRPSKEDKELEVNRKEPDVVVLGAIDSWMLAGDRKGEVKAVDTKRGRERGLVIENEDMSIEDMVRQETHTRGHPGGEGRPSTRRTHRKGRKNDLDYMDENATNLAARAPKSDINLRNAAISDLQRMNRILDSYPLCHHEDKSPPQPPIAPIVSLATRVFLTLPTEPEVSKGGAVITPIQHRTNLLECDDDEWEEIRNFMKCLTRMYHDQGRDVVFYENAAPPHRKLHAAMVAVPIPFELGETTPAFFREAILASDEEWTQYKKPIDTLKASKSGLGRQAFRKSLAKEIPYFNVWFELDEGTGHIVEGSNQWPRGDLFAREIFGGMLDVDIEVVKRQGRWHMGDRRVVGFRKRWRKFGQGC
ncbi:uncharacterized protein K441DRAFT_691161 [Cenococcum geophilum 1.58]|uniref:Uncharacterized protein n=1 Tax=Cenococcum geophilum 1.58 TaxID=794803 RepID=A0ACC8EMB4_9PEZI|nr:hypothetical protein K441DRAFT_691161 [Cenococcum geophilum 1.58]